MVDFNKQPAEPDDAWGGPTPSSEGQATPPHESQATPPPPPAWYPDPQNPAAQRWWDGVQWTAYERPATQSSTFPPAGAPMSASEERNWILAAHLSALPAAFALMAFLGPLVVFLVKGSDSPLVRLHAVAALNFHLSWLLWGVILGFATFVLLLVFVGILLIPVLAAGALAWLIIIILASAKASNDPSTPYKYPLTIAFIR